MNHNTKKTIFNYWKMWTQLLNQYFFYKWNCEWMIYVKIKVMVYRLQLIILSNCNKLYDHVRIDYIYLKSSCKTSQEMALLLLLQQSWQELHKLSFQLNPLLSLLILFTFLYVFNHIRSDKPNLPPSPPKLPFIGVKY